MYYSFNIITHVTISLFIFFTLTELKKSLTHDVVQLRCVDTECSTNQIFPEGNPDVEVKKSLDVERKSQGILCLLYNCIIWTFYDSKLVKRTIQRSK